MKLRSAPAPVPIAPPIESTAFAICSAVFVVVPWSSSVAASAATPGLVVGILRGAGTDDQPHAHRRLLVVRDTAMTCRPLARVFTA